ncbi:hypothetical protein JCM10212_004324 [Sporobolomyces blumeae]
MSLTVGLWKPVYGVLQLNKGWDLVSALASLDLSRLLTGHVVLSSLALLDSNTATWNLPVALYGLSVTQQSQPTQEAFSTLVFVLIGSAALDLVQLVFLGPTRLLLVLNFVLKLLTIRTALSQLGQTAFTALPFSVPPALSERFGTVAGGGGGFPPFGHRNPSGTSDPTAGRAYPTAQNETLWSASNGGSQAPPGSYQPRFSLDEDVEPGPAATTTTTGGGYKGSGKGAKKGKGGGGDPGPVGGGGGAKADATSGGYQTLE